jgi:hypothetical protein
LKNCPYCGELEEEHTKEQLDTCTDMWIESEAIISKILQSPPPRIAGESVPDGYWERLDSAVQKLPALEDDGEVGGEEEPFV